MTPEQRATTFAMSTAAILAITKTIIGILSGSLSVLTSAADSLGDLFVSFINFLAVGKSEVPEDHDHNYGHGKIEGFAALFEGLLIGCTGIILIIFSVKKLIIKTGITQINSSVFVMVFSMLATFFLIRHLQKIIKQTGSLIIKADELHYRTDLITNGGILISLIVIKITGLIIIDALISIVLSVYILKSSFEIIREGFHMLMDHSLPEEMRQQIIEMIKTANPRIQSFHCLRTRISGKTTFIDMHIVFEPYISLLDAHEIADGIEKRLEDAIHGSIITIHLDPFDDEKR